MDSVLSVLVTTISAMDIIEVLMYFAAHLRGDTLLRPAGPELEELKTNIKETIAQTPVPENSSLTCAQDGTLYRDQFRIDTDVDAQKLDEINRRAHDLANRFKNSESKNNIDSGSGSVSKNNIENNGSIAIIGDNNDDDNERTSDQNNNNLTCITDKNNNNAKVQHDNLACNDAKILNVENELLASASPRALTPNIDIQLENSSEMFLENERRDANETSLDSCYESLASDETTTTTTAPSVIDASRLRPLTREDEFRHTIRKRSSVSSTSSQESRNEELQILSNIEKDEQQHIDEYMPIIYPGSPLIDVLADCIETDNEPELETIIEVHSSSPDEPTAEEEAKAKRYALDKSPVPNIGIQMSLPWGDVKKEKDNKDLLGLAKSQSIEEDEVEERIDAAIETQKWVENLERDIIKEEPEMNDLQQDEAIEEPILTVIRKTSHGNETIKEVSVNELHQEQIKEEEHKKTEIEDIHQQKPVKEVIETNIEVLQSHEAVNKVTQNEIEVQDAEKQQEIKEVTQNQTKSEEIQQHQEVNQNKAANEEVQQQEQVTEIAQKKTEIEHLEGPKQISEKEPVIIQKRINLIGIQPVKDANNNEESITNKNVVGRVKDPKHDSSPSQSPSVRRRTKDGSGPKLIHRDSEYYEDSEEASLLHNLKDEKLELDVDSQFMDDPQIKEMTNYVKKLTKARVASMEQDDEEEVTQYYWKPQDATLQMEEKEVAKSPLEYQEHWRAEHLKIDEDVFSKKHPSTPRANTGYRSKSHSIAYESVKFAGHRRDSLADMLIIPTTVMEKCETSEHLVLQLEQEALEYQQLWGIDVPKLKERKHRSQSISVGSFSRRESDFDVDDRRESIAEVLILPRTASRESIDENILLQLENEALAYQFAWNLNPEEVNKRSKNRSMSISMGILARKKRARPSISRRRQSLAETFVVPKDHAGMVVDDPQLLAMLENEAYSYQQEFGIRSSDLMEPFEEDDKIDEEEEKPPNYKEWFHRFDDQTTSHIETSSFTDDEDDEVANLLKHENANEDVQVQNHIFYTFPEASKSPPSKSATPDTVIRAPVRPTTPADYENYLHKFPDQLSPEIQMDDGRKSPATLETYIAQNRLSPIPSPRAVTPEPLLAPPTAETYLERMRSTSPQPMRVTPSIEIEISATTPVIPATQSTNVSSPRALTPIRTMQNPPSLETYLARLRSQSPQAETEY